MEAQGEWPGEIGGTAQLLPLAPRAEDFRHGPHAAGTPLAGPVTPRPFPARSPETARGGFPLLPYSEMTPPGRAFVSGATAGSEPAPWPGTEAETAPAAWSEVRPSPPPAAPAMEEAWPAPAARERTAGSWSGPPPAAPAREEAWPSPTPTARARAAQLWRDPASGSVPNSEAERWARQSDAAGFANELARLGHVLAAAAGAAPEALTTAGFATAADVAGSIESLSRTVEYLQLLAADAVDRTRTAAVAAARDSLGASGKAGWVTGWDAKGIETLNETDAGWSRALVPSPNDDGTRNTAEFLRVRLRISVREARRRLNLAHQILPATTLTGEQLPAPLEHLAAAFAKAGTGCPGNAAIPAETVDPEDVTDPADTAASESAAPKISSYAATIIASTLDRLQHSASAEILGQVEQHLTGIASKSDPDVLVRVAQKWAETIDADGSEPTEEALRHTQGAFIRKQRNGLHHLEIFATTDQFEHFLTVMNTATNPRSSTPGTDSSPDNASSDRGCAGEAVSPNIASANVWREAEANLERRTRPQQQLDGLVCGLKAGLTTALLPVTGGNRPQIIATIDHKDLFPVRSDGDDSGRQFSGSNFGKTFGVRRTTNSRTTNKGATTATATPDPTASNANTLRSPSGVGSTNGTGAGAFVFTGPVAAATLRKIACDADIIPVVLGSRGEILDVGRKSRLFTQAQRLALIARDRGCAFPDCTIPAPWCEAHHITYWSQGGTTATDNGVLLCSHHHHIIHKELWTITVAHGIPTFIPPRHIDPTRSPRHNRYFKPPPPPESLQPTASKQPALPRQAAGRSTRLQL